MSNTAPTVLDEFNADFGITEPDVAQPELTKDGKPAPAAKPEAKFRREIDLGDGSGVQVFEGETAEVLIDKLAEAQRNATIKIRHQTHLLKRPVHRPAPKPEPTKSTVVPLSPDEEFQIGQQFGSAPSRYFERLFEATVGMKPSELQADLVDTRARNKEIAETMVGQEFVVDHFEDYVPTPRNYRALKSFLTDEGLEFTKENLDYAFQELSTSGLLEKPQAAKPAQPADGTRIETKPVAEKPLSSGLSGRESTPTTPNEPAAVDAREAERHARTIPLAQLEREIRSRTTRR